MPDPTYSVDKQHDQYVVRDETGRARATYPSKATADTAARGAAAVLSHPANRTR